MHNQRKYAENANTNPSLTTPLKVELETHYPQAQCGHSHIPLLRVVPSEWREPPVPTAQPTGWRNPLRGDFRGAELQKMRFLEVRWFPKNASGGIEAKVGP